MATATYERNGSANGDEIHAIALRYLTAGFNVIPIRADGSKAPDISEWKRFQKIRVKENCLKGWFRQGYAGGVAIVGGPPSGNLVILDFEFTDYWEEFVALVEAERPGLVGRLPLVMTPGKDEGRGRHLYFRTKGETPRSTKLAKMTAEEAEKRTGDKGAVTAIEIKGAGGYVLAPGCPPACHKTGRIYEPIAGPPITETPALEPEEVETLLDCARALNRVQAVAEAKAEAARKAERRTKLAPSAPGDRPGDLFNRQASWEDVLGAFGWKVDCTRGDVTYWTRPGKTKGISASTGHCSSSQSGNLLYVFSSNAEPFEAEKTYSKFTAFALLNHGGDFCKAARDLREAGYRPERSRPQGLNPNQAEEQRLAQQEADGEFLATLLDQLDSSLALALRLALENVPTLARLKLTDPSRYELVLLEFREAGASVRDMQGLERPVSQAVKGVKQEAKQQQRAEAAKRREQSSHQMVISLANYFENEETNEEGQTALVRIGYPLPCIGQHLEQIVPGWPKRIDSMLFVEAAEYRPLFLDSASALFAWIANRLPTGGNRNHLIWGKGDDMATEIQFHAWLSQNVERYNDLERFPHEPLLSGHYYMHPPTAGGDGIRFQQLLRFFCPASDLDADLVKAFFLTLFWGGRPGSRPAFLFTGKADDPKGGRGIGKSTIPHMGAHLAGGYISLSTGDKFTDLITRILSQDAAGKRIVLLDNLKSLRLSWAELEALVTTTEVSGRRLYYGEGSRPNHFVLCLTVNGASVSKDLAQRCVPVELTRPEYSATWQQDVEDFIDEHRWAIIGDILAELRREPLQLGEHSRWGLWESQVLCRASPEPAEVLRVIEERRKEADDDDAEADLVREKFCQELRERKHDPETDVVFIPSQIAAEFTNYALGERRPVNKACSYLNTLSIAELRKGEMNQKRGFRWTGVNSPAGEPAVMIKNNLASFAS